MHYVPTSKRNFCVKSRNVLKTLDKHLKMIYHTIVLIVEKLVKIFKSFYELFIFCKYFAMSGKGELLIES